MISSWWALFSGFWAWSLELIGLLLFFLFFFSVLRLFFLSDLLSLLILFWNMGRDNFLVYFETMFGHWENAGKKKKNQEKENHSWYISYNIWPVILYHEPVIRFQSFLFFSSVFSASNRSMNALTPLKFALQVWWFDHVPFSVGTS